ncbi:MAG TPA: hypothetical protein VHL12_01855 [Gemmatimonadaceae bacterium]|nr:hypothetical protein [Gemmatimonadaceae bacterium]
MRFQKDYVLSGQRPEFRSDKTQGTVYQQLMVGLVDPAARPGRMWEWDQRGATSGVLYDVPRTDELR